MIDVTDANNKLVKTFTPVRGCGVVNSPLGDQCQEAIKGCKNDTDFLSNYQSLYPNDNLECKCSLCTKDGCNGANSHTFSSKINVCILLLVSMISYLF